MSKLHEVLAVESSLSNVAEQLTKESTKTFNKENLFKGQIKVHSVFDDNMQHAVQADVVVEVETTVEENLQYLFDTGLAPYWDAVAQKDEANQRSKADIVIDGEVIVADVAGTTLLGLEAKLGKLLHVFQAIPSLPSGRTWVQDENQRKGVLVDPLKEERTQSHQVPDFKVLYEATKEHKAQIREFETTVQTGKFTVTNYSGQVSSLAKAKYMTRLQTLLSAVKQARQRANCVEVQSVHIGKNLTKYLLG